MSVKTRFGTEVTILSGHLSKGYVRWKDSKGKVHHGYIHDLVASNGFGEIADSIRKANGGIEDNPEDDFDHSEKGKLAKWKEDTYANEMRKNQEWFERRKAGK